MVAKSVPIDRDYGQQNVFLPLSRRYLQGTQRGLPLSRRPCVTSQQTPSHSFPGAARLSGRTCALPGMRWLVCRCFETDKQGYHFEICPFKTVTQIDRGHRTLAGSGANSRWLRQATSPKARRLAHNTQPATHCSVGACGGRSPQSARIEHSRPIPAPVSRIDCSDVRPRRSCGALDVQAAAGVAELEMCCGEFCGAVHASRTSRIIFKCGLRDEIISVSETETCSYAVTMQTPAACDP